MGNSLYLNKDMAKRLDAVFPEAGGLMHLAEVREEFIRSIPDSPNRAGNTSFHVKEAEHIRKAFTLLGDDEVAKSTLMSWLAFAQMKNDVAGF